MAESTGLHEIKPVRCGCGGEAKIDKIQSVKGNRYSMICQKCLISTAYKYNTEAEAIEAWNRAMGAVENNRPETEEDSGNAKRRTWTNHEVACLLAELFGDDCACNFNGINEWLPEKCDFIDICPNTVGVACWEQFLKYRGD